MTDDQEQGLYDDSPYAEVTECWFYVKDENGKILLRTQDYLKAFDHKKMIPGSRVFVEAKVDATIESMESMVNRGVFGGGN